MKTIKMKKLIILAAFIAALPRMVAAQDSTDGSQTTQLTLKEAVENAVQYSKSLQASKLDIELYQQKVRETMSGNLPQVTAELGYTTYFGKSMEFSGMEIEMEDAIDFSATAAWTLSMQQVFSVKVQKLAKQAIEIQVEADELDVKANVIDTYYTILVYRRNVKLLEQNLAEMEEIKNHTENMYNAGSVELTEVDQIRVSMATIKNSLISMQRSMETTKRLLVLQMGLPINTKIEPSLDLEDLILDRTVAALDSSRFDMTQNLDYRAIELSNEVNERTLKVQRWAWAPTLTATYVYTNPIKGGFMTFDHVGTLTLSWNAFTGFKRDSQIKQAKIEVERGEINKALLEDNLTQNEEQYRYELNTAIEAYLLQKENLEVAKRVLDNYRNKYNQGVLSSMDLSQANTDYLSAETSYASACLTLLTAHTQLGKLCNQLEY